MTMLEKVHKAIRETIDRCEYMSTCDDCVYAAGRAAVKAIKQAVETDHLDVIGSTLDFLDTLDAILHEKE